MRQGSTKSLLVLLAAFTLFAGFARAQDAAVSSSTAPAEMQDEETVQGIAENRQSPDELLDPNLYMGIQEAHQRSLKMRGVGVRPNEIQTLFFTLWQHSLLQEAKQQMWRNRGVEDYEKNRQPGQEPPRIKGPRELALGGIVFSDGEDWVVWLNGQRLTPKAIPKEVMDIQVKKDFVELRWFDSWTNLIYPVRLRPHQRFNLDSRIFLPGTSQL